MFNLTTILKVIMYTKILSTNKLNTKINFARGKMVSYNWDVERVFGSFFVRNFYVALVEYYQQKNSSNLSSRNDNFFSPCACIH